MALLRGMSGPAKGKIFQLEGETITIGRGPDNEICVPDPSVSTHHGTIQRDGEKYTLHDLDSTNGTRLNGEVIKTTRLKPKDIIQVGTVDLMFDGKDVEVDTQDANATVSRSASGAIAAIEERSPGSGPVSSAFGKKRDHRHIVNAVIYLIAGLAVAGLVIFVLMLFRE